jgi:hypothetical protein
MAGAARSRIILVEPRPQRDAASAPKSMVISGFLKMSQILTLFSVPIYICNYFNQAKIRGKVAQTLMLT